MRTATSIAMILTSLGAASGLIGPVAAAESPSATEILDAAGVKGGLVVHVGCGDGTLTAALGAEDAYLVHGLDTDAANIEKSREAIGRLGVYGRVSVDTFDGRHLPYTDDTVNLLVAEDLGDVAMEEATRVLAPLGVAYVKQGGTWSKTAKPWPAEIDQWTHYLHDASNNAVAHDQRIGPPRHLQWQCGPRWSRHHDHMASVSALVSSGGRVFYILDEGSRVSPQLPADWKLIARDAFSGVLLWKRPIAKWHDHLWPLKSGPASLPRRLVAEDAVVYTTLGITAPVTALDSASGKTLREYPRTDGAEEIVLIDGVLLVLVNRTPDDPEADLAGDPEEGRSRDSRTTYSPKMAEIWAGIRSRRWTHADRAVIAFDARSGRPLWEKTGRVIPLTLAADGDSAYYHDGEKVVAVELASGKERWASEPVAVWEGLESRGLQSWFAPTLVVHDGMVLFAGGEKMHMSYMGWGSKDIGEDTMTAFSAKTGKKLWSADHPYCGYNSPEDLFIAGGKVWSGTTAKGGPNGRYVGRDLRSGEMTDDFPPTLSTFWFHHRCHRAKATDNYILCSRTGIEFVDLKTGQWTINHWVRGGCLYGIMPSCGLIYSPQHPCACYPEAKLNGFTALAAASPSRALSTTIPTTNRLQRGPAYNQIRNQKSEILNPNDWPTYRHDPARSGSASTEMRAELRRSWQARLGGRLTQPIAAAGRLFVADVDRHAVLAVDAASGKTLWSYVAGGRVDSPPTYCHGHLLFGAADGHVYCLRAADGVLVWRFRVAPLDRRLVAFEQVESVWPVPGAVLVRDGVATAVAGRSMFLDGGLRLCRLDVETGRLLGEQVFDDRDPRSGENLQVRVQGLNMPVALPDVLASDGQYLYMRSQAMDLEGTRLEPGRGADARHHLIAPYGFTDDSWFHRTYWVFGTGFQGGIGGYGNGRKSPAGRILVNDEATVFGYGRKPQYFRWSSVLDYQLFAAVRPGGEAPEGGPSRDAAPRRGKAKTSVAYRWTRDVPLMVRAMVLAGDVLLIAGPPDLVDEDAAFQSYADAATGKRLRAQDAAWKGRTGALMHAIDATTGETLSEYKLDALPVFDGLIVADGKVFFSTTDDRIVCMGAENQ